METKPIKRNKNLLPVSREHHTALLFCWKVRQGAKKKVERERIKKYIAVFYETHLLPHFELEEKYLFTDEKDDKVKRALREHIELRKSVSGILHGAETSDKVFLDLADALDKHVRFEERDLFPHLESVFAETKLQEVGKYLHEEGNPADDGYEDEFWATPKH